MFWMKVPQLIYSFKGTFRSAEHTSLPVISFHCSFLMPISLTARLLHSFLISSANSTAVGSPVISTHWLIETRLLLQHVSWYLCYWLNDTLGQWYVVVMPLPWLSFRDYPIGFSLLISPANSAARNRLLNVAADWDWSPVATPQLISVLAQGSTWPIQLSWNHLRPRPCCNEEYIVLTSGKIFENYNQLQTRGIQ